MGRQVAALRDCSENKGKQYERARAWELDEILG